MALAVSKYKRGKAPASDGLMADHLKAGGFMLLDFLCLKIKA